MSPLSESITNIWRWQVRASSYNSNKLTNQMQQFHKLITWRFVSLNVFRAPSRPSAGAYNCTNSCKLEISPSSGAYNCINSCKLVMMGVEAPETCWPTQKRQAKNLWNYWFWLFNLFEILQTCLEVNGRDLASGYC